MLGHMVEDVGDGENVGKIGRRVYWVLELNGFSI
jgi:hypothetical protein